MPLWSWIFLLLSCVTLGLTVGYVVGFNNGQKDGKDIGFSNGVIAHTKWVQGDPSGMFPNSTGGVQIEFGPVDIPAGKTVKMGTIRLVNDDVETP